MKSWNNGITKLIMALIVSVSFFLFQTSTYAAADTWTYQSPMPYNRLEAGVVEVGGKVYFIGGFVNNAASAKVDVFDPQSNTWTSKSNMPTARSSFSTEVVGGKIYVMGGSQGNPVVLNTTYTNVLEVYDPVLDTWTTKTPSSVVRGLTASAAVYGKIYLIGGLNATSVGLNKVEEYNIASNTWTTKTNIPTAVHAPGATAYGGKIYVFDGGYEVATYNKVQVYDPALDTWSYKSSAPTSRDNVVAVNFNNKIYVIGGYIDVNTGISTVESYDPVNDSWKTEANLNFGRWGFGSVVLNNSLYVFGGGVNTVEKLNLAISEVPVTGRAILTIYLTNGTEKEYDLAMTEVNSFIQWYDAKDSGVGPAKYKFIKTWNIGPFKSRTEYVIFDKILTFNVDEYSVEE